jgi:glycosyltransferase involved in cell wall biosynthesis
MLNRLKISVLVCNLSANSIVRTYPIAKVLERHHDVQVVGPVLGNHIFAPYKNELNYVPIYPKGPSLLKYKNILSGLLASITGDVIYAFKPAVTSYGVALLSQLKRRRSIILDIEDLDNEPFESLSLYMKVLDSTRHCYHISGFHNWVVDSLHGLANTKTVVSNFLQRRYGGVKLPHGADSQVFDPHKFDRRSLRREYGLGDKKVIVFAGTIRQHKGLDLLLEAVMRLNREDVLILVAGMCEPVVEKLLKSRPFVRLLGPQPHSKMPGLWLIADVVVLPQRNTRVAQAQVPGKVFEAMAMARPIIASSVSDLPEILDQVGWLVPPDDILALTGTLGEVLSKPAKAEERGEAARERFLQRYSWDAMDEILTDLISKL